MKRLLLLLVLFLTATGCAHLPKIDPMASDCPVLTPQGKWQLYHAMEATVPGGRKATLTGVSVVSSEDRSIRWALMTVEGFVLFSGRFDGVLKVDRAVSPFDRPGFAQGLTEDLLLLFFTPQAPLYVAGRLHDGRLVCRYASEEYTTDVTLNEDGTWSICQYNSNHRIIRTVTIDEMRDIGGQFIASHLILENKGLLGYRLELRLIEATPLKDDDAQK